ncbi:DUF305 domain-containing protein [Nocardia sp. NPDC059180]|uniref:DUF305 domain-containing protein n=1 Tax=Nocardia sp. NPDC059180 TaxID=3346761 RepID=UPI0036BD1962
MFITRTRLLIAVAAVALTVAGCSDDSTTATESTTSAAATTTSSTRTDFNDADVAFLQMMYPHHAQAVDMAKMVPSRTQNPQLLALATAIEGAQAPEMQQITALLESFGKPAPTAGEHGEHGGHGAQMPGMMTPEQMTALENATGAEFDRQWIQMMIEHHTGAIDMANTELADGVNADTKALATTIIAAQQVEIDQMRQMLGQN